VTGDILAVNAGSSSIKVSVFATGIGGDPVARLHAQVEGIGTPHPHAVGRDAAGRALFDVSWPGGDGPRDHGGALSLVIARLTDGRPSWAPAGIGHRIVHGGPRFSAPVRIDPAVRAYLESIVPLTPLHAPAGLKGIDAATAAFPGVPQVACFDTAFHAGRPFAAAAYALPREYFDEGVRRYGFHGLSYEYIVREMRRTAPDVARGRMVVCHLGNGASMAAVRDGRCVETTMGFTPTDGLPMGTRCGQIDPGVLIYLLREKGMSPAGVDTLIEKRSGLLGLSGIGADMRDLLASPDPRARDAVDCFVYRVTYFVGALAACLGGLDGIVFTAGIGEHAAPVRAKVCRNLGWLGLGLDEAANAADAQCISAPGSKVSAWVIPTDEDQMIAAHVAEALAPSPTGSAGGSGLAPSPSAKPGGGGEG